MATCRTSQARRKRSWRHRLAIAAAVAVATAPLPAAAAAGPTADELKEGLRLALNQTIAAFPVTHPIGIDQVGDVGVFADRNGWRFEVDHLDLPHRRGPRHMEALSGKVVESAQGFDIELPLPEKIIGDDGKTVAELPHGRLAYVWSPTLQTLVETRFSAGPLNLLPGQEDLDARLGRLERSMTLNATDGSGYRLRQETLFDGLALVNDTSRFWVDRVRANARGALRPGTDIAAFNRMLAYNAFLSENESLAQRLDTEAWIDWISTFLHMSGSIEIEDVTLRGEAGALDLQRMDITTGYTTSDANESANESHLAYWHQGLSIPHLPSRVAVFAPTNLLADFSFEKLSLTAMLREIATTYAAMEREEDNDRLAKDLARRLGTLVRSQGTVVRLDDLAYVSEMLTVTGSGVAVAGEQAATGMIGSLDLEIAGLDKAVEAAPALFKGEQAPTAILLMAKGLGLEAVADDGRLVHRYHFELGGDGTLLLNGQDMAPLLAVMRSGRRG